MNDTILVDRGDTISFTGVWADEAGAAMNLTGCTLAIGGSNQSALLAHAVVTILDAVAGTFRFYLAAAQGEALPNKRATWFRMALTSANGDVDATPKIWIEFQ